MTPIDEVKAERAEFEKYYRESRKSKGKDRMLVAFNMLGDGTYAVDSVQRHWWTWQQARALLHRSQGQEPVARNNALRDDHPLSKGFCAHDVSMAKHCAACAKPPSRDTVVPAEQAEDSAMLDWLDQNIFNHEMDDWDRRLHPDSLMWVVYGPTGVQGSARAILRAAIRAAMSNREAGGS